MPTDSCDPSSSANVTDISEVPEKKSLAKKALQKLSWKGKGKQPSWPEPEKSIGDFKSKIGSQSYWTVQARSPARDAYKEIAPKVKKYLEDYMGDDTLKLFYWSLYMVGESKDTASPTIVFCCEHSRYRKNAVELIWQSGILDEFPGFLLSHLPWLPGSTGPLVEMTTLPSSAEPGGSDRKSQSPLEKRTLQSTTDSMDTVRELSKYESFPRIYNYNQRTESGSKICTDGGKANGDNRKATIGGPLYIDGICCFMTAAHAFVEAAVPRYPDLPFSDTEDYHTAASSESIGPKYSGSIEAVPMSTHSPSVSQEPEQSARFIGRLFYSSNKDGRAELDYALGMTTRNDNLEWKYATTLKAGIFKLPLYTRKARFEDLEDTSVFSWTASAYLSGSIDPTPAFVWHPGSKMYRLVFSVQFTNSLALGDSGAWVHSKSNGILHGHITTGSPRDGLALIVPAYQVFDDIRSNLKSGTPSWTSFSECRKKLQPSDTTITPLRRWLNESAQDGPWSSAARVK
ncbi:hypothetical protein BS50DRAFT_574800 [Corynespora cassiicola Philippines]|uniref:Uncharacterized protein n=1 Tax=Corynespora cassiicola Philippines TaxID=1448308 RepID=A0A2T2NLY3_CORCC|nr:hypothetical protein BS50DRAFT_574800 [Corynespora cassiicola Philippines]